MADAGRVLIIPRGTYDANVAYEMLDLVLHNDTSWLAKKDVIGIEPTNENSEHWFKLVEIDKDAETLEGYQAKDFLKKAFERTLEDVDIKEVVTDLELCPLGSITRLRVCQPTNAPIENGDFYATVERADTASNIRITAKCVETNRTWEATMTNGEWGAWEKLSTTTELEDSLPKKYADISVPVESWTADTTYGDYPYKADIACVGITAEHFADVIFDVPDAVGGNYAPVAKTGDGIVSIYAREIPTDAITIQTIKCEKVVAV